MGASRADERGHALDEALVLPGAGGGLDEKRGAEVLADRVAGPSSSGRASARSVRLMDLPERPEHGQAASSPASPSIAERPRGLLAAADGLVVAEPAVFLVDGVGKRAGAQQVEQPPRTSRVSPGSSAIGQPLSLALAAREEVARARRLAPRSRARPRRTLQGHGVERVLDLATAVDATLLLVAPGAARLVVPDVERAVGRLVDAVDRAAQRKGLAGADRRSRRARGWRSRPGPRRGAGRRRPRSSAASLSGSAPPRARRNVRQATRMSSRRCPKASSRGRRDLLPPGGDLPAAISSRSPACRAASGFSPDGGDPLEEEAEDFVQEGARRHRHRATRVVSRSSSFGRLDAQDVLQEVTERDTGPASRCARPTAARRLRGVELGGPDSDPAVVDREVIGVARLPRRGGRRPGADRTRGRWERRRPPPPPGRRRESRESHHSVSSSAASTPGRNPAGSGSAASSAL